MRKGTCMESCLKEANLAICKQNGHVIAQIFTAITGGNSNKQPYYNVEGILNEVGEIGEDTKTVPSCMQSLQGPFISGIVPSVGIDEATLWWEALVGHVRVLFLVQRKVDYEAAFTEQLALVHTIQRIFTNATKWILPLIYILGDELWWLGRSTNSEESMQECARAINKTLTLCLTDRAPMGESRKWGTYRSISLLFKIYFHLDQLNLCANVLRAMGNAELPAEVRFPAAHLVTFHFYLGRYHFVNEQYEKAMEKLEVALARCPHHAHHNKRLILHFLIPLKLLTGGAIPSSAILQRYGLQDGFYLSILEALRLGNLPLYQSLLSKYENALLRMGTFLVWEKLFLVAYRSLVRRIFIINEKNTRLPVSSVQLVLRRLGMGMSGDEISCFIANLIDKGLVRGYVSQEKATLVLSQKDPFPAIK